MSTGERDPEDRGRGDVAEDLIATQPRSERSCTFLDGVRSGRRTNAVEGPHEVLRVESAAGNATVQCVLHPEGGVTEGHGEPTSRGHGHSVRGSRLGRGASICRCGCRRAERGCGGVPALSSGQKRWAEKSADPGLSPARRLDRAARTARGRRRVQLDRAASTAQGCGEDGSGAAERTVRPRRGRVGASARPAEDCAAERAERITGRTCAPGSFARSPARPPAPPRPPRPARSPAHLARPAPPHRARPPRPAPPVLHRYSHDPARRPPLQ